VDIPTGSLAGLQKSISKLKHHLIPYPKYQIIQPPPKVKLGLGQNYGKKRLN
jgi:hypothetical protein